MAALSLVPCGGLPEGTWLWGCVPTGSCDPLLMFCRHLKGSPSP